MSKRRDAATDEHTLNIMTGIITLKTKYGLTIDEYDYIDFAVDALRDIRYYGTTEYYATCEVDEEGNIPAPCNAFSIDAVTSLKQGLKQFGSRMEYKLLQEYGTDSFYTARKVADSSDWKLGTSGLTKYDDRIGYISYYLIDSNLIHVGEEHAGNSIVVAFTGISVDKEGYPMITRKQANALAVYSGKYMIIKNLARGNAKQAQLLEFFIAESGRLMQSASLPEDITDNELEELMDAKTSFNRKSFRRPMKYSR